jgi:hypothetical protein
MDVQSIRYNGFLVRVTILLSLYTPWRPLGLREVEAPTFSDIRLTDGGKVVSLMRWPLFTPRAVVRLEGLGKLKKIHLIRDSNRRPSRL